MATLATDQKKRRQRRGKQKGITMGLITKLFGTRSEREVKKIEPIIAKIEALAPQYQAMSDTELKAVTPQLKQRLADGQTLDDILPDAFAAVREAADRVLGMRPYPGAAHRRRRPSPGAHCRDEDR